MQKLVVLSVCLFLSCSAGPVFQNVEAVEQKVTSELASTAYAVDLSIPISLAGFQCIQRNLYSTAFIRAYTPVGQGQIDDYAVSNIQFANAAGLGAEAYMTPQPNSAKTGAQQFDEMFSNLANSNINVQSIWIQVTSPTNWYMTSSLNVNFLNSILQRANQYDLTIGIYTNINEWNQITGSATINNAMLWYWNTNGGGVSNESPANFNDFRSFAGWSSPSVKQFAQAEEVCGLMMNRDIYSTSSAAISGMARRENFHHIVVGGLGLGGTLLAGKVKIGGAAFITP